MAVLIYNYRFTRRKNEVKSNTDQRIGYGERTTRKEDTDLLHTAHVLKPASGIFQYDGCGSGGKICRCKSTRLGRFHDDHHHTHNRHTAWHEEVSMLSRHCTWSRGLSEVHKTVHTSVILCFIAGLLLLVTGLAFSKPLLEVMNTKPELIDGATAYLMIYLCGSPALALYNFGNGVLSAVGDTKRPLIY